MQRCSSTQRPVEVAVKRNAPAVPGGSLSPGFGPVPSWQPRSFECGAARLKGYAAWALPQPLIRSTQPQDQVDDRQYRSSLFTHSCRCGEKGRG